MTSASSVYRDLDAALRERLVVIADREHYQHDPSGHLERLKTATAKIDALRDRLPDGDHPQLAHYLQRCSYDKALTFLEAIPE